MNTGYDIRERGLGKTLAVLKYFSIGLAIAAALIIASAFIFL